MAIINANTTKKKKKKKKNFRLSELEVIVSRLLEKALRRSRAIDTEGLCIIAGEKVWSIRVDIRVLDHEGNITDCACIAAIAALYHFRRPEYTIEDDEVTIVSFHYL